MVNDADHFRIMIVMAAKAVKCGREDAKNPSENGTKFILYTRSNL